VTDAEVKDLVRQRAGDRCEYCGLRQKHSHLAHHIEHIVAKQHGGTDELGNLALACHRCNLRKGPNLTGIDPVTEASLHSLTLGEINGGIIFE
jgi:5-methylcytosine-specific restriction endonuclease McrA